MALLQTSHGHGRRGVGGFTLIEMLVGVAIIGLLVTLLLPWIKNGVKSAGRAKCSSNLRQLGTAALTYAGENDGALPPGQSWDRDIAPYLGIDLVNPASSTPPSSVLICPADPKPAGREQRSYSASSVFADPNGVYDSRGVFGRSASEPSRKLVMIRFPATTVMLMELYNANNKQWRGAFIYTQGWLNGNPGPRLADGSYYHQRGQNYVFCDGHVELLSTPEVQQNPPISGWSNGRWSIGPQ